VRVRSESAQSNRPLASVLGAGCDVGPLGGLDGAGTFPGVGSTPELRTGDPLTGAAEAGDIAAREVATGGVATGTAAAGVVAAAWGAVVASAVFAGVGLAGEVAAGVCPAGDAPAGVVLEVGVAAAVGLTGDVAAGFAGEVAVGLAGDAAADDVPPASAGVESTAGPFAPSCVAIDPGEMVLDASTPVSVGIADAFAAAVLPLGLMGFPLDRLAMMNITPIRAATAATMTMTRRSQ